MTDKMTPSEEQGVRRSIDFMEQVQHEHLICCMGQWEDPDIIFVVRNAP